MAPQNFLCSRLVNTILLLLMLALLVCVILLGSVPPTSRDALIHHLFIPKIYLQHGKIFEIPEFSWSYYPMNLDLLYMIPLSWGNDIIPNYIHFSFAIATSWLIYRYLKKRLNPTFGLLGSLFFLSIPIIVKLSTTAYVDLGLIFFSTASFLFLLVWAEQEVITLRTLLFAGVLCGLAAGTKYNGMITLLILTLFLPILYIRSPSRWTNHNTIGISSTRYCGLFFLSAMMIFSPWLIRNFIWTNNPIFPLLNNWFNHQTPPVHKVIHLDIFSIRRVLFHESTIQILLLPFRIFFEGKDDNPQYFDGVLSPFLLLLPLFAFVRPSKNRILEFEKYAMLGFVLLSFAFTSLNSGMRVRYISPIIPFLVILCILGLEKILSFESRTFPSLEKKYVTLIGIAIVGLMLGFNILYIFQQFQIVQPISYISGKISRDDYISHFLQEYPIVLYINKTLPQNAKVLALYLGNRGYYFERSVEFDMQNEQSIFFDIINQSRPPEDVYLSLKQKGITHLIIRYDLFKNQSQQILSDEKQSVTDAFLLNFTKKIFENNQYGLFELGVYNRLKEKSALSPIAPNIN